MVRVNKIWEYLNFVLNKEQAGNTINLTEFNILLPVVNLSFFKQRYGLPEQYTPGQPLPQMSYEITQKITDDLRAFKVRMGIDTQAMTVDAQGQAPIPSDYVHYSSARYNMIKDNVCGTVEMKPRTIEHLTDAQLGDRLGAVIKKPTLRNPIFSTYSTYFQFYPKTIKRVEFTYLRMPRTPVYGYIPDVETDTDIYNEATSVHFEYPDDCFNDIAMLCLSLMAANLRAPEIVQYAETIKTKGI